MQFTDFIDQPIRLAIPALNATKIQTYTLIGVESGGLWVHSQDYTNSVLQILGTQTAPKTMVLFVPYQQIALGFASIEGPSLDEKAFGV